MAMSNISQLIKDVRNEDEFRPDLHQAVLDEIDRAGADGFSLIEAAEAFRYLRDLIYFHADIKRGPPPDGADQWPESPVIDEEEYKDEITRMRKLQDYFRISDTLQEWISGKRRELVRKLQEDNFHYRVYHWDRLGPDERKDLLRELNTMQREVFGGKEFMFHAPEIAFVKDSPDDTPPLITYGTASIDGQRIGINERRLKDGCGFDAIVTMFHEGVHNIIAQLVYAAGNGDFGPDHPLYADVRRRGAQKLERLSIDNIASLYNTNSEERLIANQQDRFIRELYSDNTLRSQFRLTAYCMMNDLRRDMPKVAQFLQRFVPY